MELIDNSLRHCPLVPVSVLLYPFVQTAAVLPDMAHTIPLYQVLVVVQGCFLEDYAVVVGGVSFECFDVSDGLLVMGCINSLALDPVLEDGDQDRGVCPDLVDVSDEVLGCYDDLGCRGSRFRFEFGN